MIDPVARDESPNEDRPVPSPNGAAAVEDGPRKRPRTGKGRFASVAATLATEALEEAVPAGGGGRPAPPEEDAAPPGAAPGGPVEAPATPRGTGAPPLDEVPFVSSASPAEPSAPALFEPLPDLRRRTPAPVIPWHLRAQRRLKEATQPGRVEAEHDALLDRLTGALAGGTRHATVISPKGGAGKSTLVLTAGLVLAGYDAARPVLVELNPDWGSLRRLVGRGNPRTIIDLLDNYTAIERAGLGLLQSYVTMFGRLPVLLAPANPDQMARLTARDYDRVLRLLSQYFGICLCDAGTGYRDRLTQYAIQRADHLAVVATPDEGTTMTCLESIQYLASARYEATYRGALDDVAGDAPHDVKARLLEDISLVVNRAGEPGMGDAPVDPAKLRQAAGGCNAVLELPYSPKLKTLLADGTLTVDNLPVPYRRAVKKLLAAILGRLAERPARVG